MKVFFKKNPALQEKLEASTKITSIGNNDVKVYITGQDATIYPTSYDVTGVSFTREELEKILAEMETKPKE